MTLLTKCQRNVQEEAVKVSGISADNFINMDQQAKKLKHGFNNRNCAHDNTSNQTDIRQLFTLQLAPGIDSKQLMSLSSCINGEIASEQLLENPYGNSGKGFVRILGG
jgi:cell division protein FtsX